MRRYDILSGILVILSIIGFALAAPIPVQEKRQAYIDVVHIPRDAITVSAKRGNEDLDFARLALEYFKKMQKPVESSDAPASSGLAPLGPDHESTNVVQAAVPNPASSDAHASSSSAPPGPYYESTNVAQGPAPNPASSTANPDTLMKPSSPSSSSTGSSDLSDSEYLDMLYEFDGLPAPHSPQPNTKKRPWTDMEPDPDFDWNHWMTSVKQARPRPAPPKEFGQANEYQVQPDPVPSTALDFNRIYPPVPPSAAYPVFPSARLPTVPEHEVLNAPYPDPWSPTISEYSESTSPSPPGAGSPTVPKHEELTSPSPGAGSPTVPEHEEATPPSPYLGSPKEPENEVVPGPPPTPESTDPELHSDPQSLSAGVQPEDLQAAIYNSEYLQAALYAGKGKAKESRRISGTARDVGNAAQRELLPDGRSLNPDSEFLSRPSQFYQPS